MAENPPPTSGLTPYLTIKGDGASAAAAFYERAFTAHEVARHVSDDGKRLLHSHLIVNGASLMLSDDFPEYTGGAPDPGGYTLHLQVDDADAWWDRAVSAGCIITMPIDLQFWGDRYGQLRDPFGVSWSIGSTPKS